MKQLFFLMVVTVFSTPVFAEKQQVQSTEASDQRTVVEQSQLNSDSKLYQKLYDVSVKSNESLVQSTQNSINIVVGFILFLFGSQAFYKYQVAKKEIESLKAKLGEQLASESSRVDVELANFRESILSEVSKKIESNYKETKKEFSNELEHKVERADEALNRGYEDLRLALQTHVETINFQFDTVRSELWSVKGVTSNVLTSLASQYKYHLANENQPPAYLLRDVLANLKKARKIEKKTRVDLVTCISSTLGQDVYTSQIEELLNSLPQYEFIKDSNGNVHAVDLT